MKHSHAHESDEPLVVALADAVVQPRAVMVEVLHAFIASATVLRTVAHVMFAYLTLNVALCVNNWETILNSMITKYLP